MTHTTEAAAVEYAQGAANAYRSAFVVVSYSTQRGTKWTQIDARCWGEGMEPRSFLLGNAPKRCTPVFVVEPAHGSL
jgi:hypothetical protein